MAPTNILKLQQNSSSAFGQQVVLETPGHRDCFYRFARILFVSDIKIKHFKHHDAFFDFLINFSRGQLIKHDHRLGSRNFIFDAFEYAVMS
ncbi:unnamed protein product [Aureobasidium vineae]|uniref:Uncharacterized protein n=1 Tax=Aureobasidium vineae TaxID=2773715 RepID=A0A9N8PG09_9PEZI|nr:unnamed protein product [Aureobasidium vineae]